MTGNLLFIKVEKGIIKNVKDGETCPEPIADQIAASNSFALASKFCEYYEGKSLILNYDTLAIVREVEKCDVTDIKS